MAFEFPATTLYDRTGSRFDFSSLDALVEFLENEDKEWTFLVESLPSSAKTGTKIVESRWPISHLLSSIKELKNAVNENKNEGEWKRSWDKIQSLIGKSFSGSSTSYWISATRPAFHFWGQAAQHGQRAGDAFFEYVIDQKISQPENAYSLLGALLAYEFQMQGDSSITKRRDAEEASFELLRTQLLQRKNQLIEEVAKIQSDHAQWFENTSAQWSQSHQERQSVFEAQQSSHQQIYAYQHENQQEQFAQFMQEKTHKITELEHTYQEKLRLQGPAQYWRQSAKTLLKQGRIFGAMLMVVLVGSISIVFTLLYQWIANGTIHVFNLQNLQGALLFASLVSLIAYTVKTFARLTFSSFHLQRDAEEREQLTYLYLALGNQGDIDADSRKILYQALFSRSETGLLHKEQGPTMPSLMNTVMQGRPS